MRTLALVLCIALGVPATGWAAPDAEGAAASTDVAPAPAPRRRSISRRPDQDPIDYAEALEDGYGPRPSEETPGSLAATLMAIGPGFVVHGAGHLVMDERRTGVLLMLTELASLMMILGGAAADAATNGSASVATATDALTHAGLVLFVGSWVADIIGSFTGTVPYDPDTTRVEGSVFGVAYRYTDSPLDTFRHHLVARLSIDFGWLYLRPEIDLEAGLDARQAEFDAGLRLLGNDPHEHLAVGVIAQRREDEPNGFAASGLMTYVWGKADLGRYMRTLRHVYLAGKIGYGFDGYQFTRAGSAPSFFSEVEFTDTRLVLQSGMGFNTGERTHMLVLWSGDTVSDIPPSSSFGQVEVMLQHRYLDTVDIDVNLTMGDGFAIRLGLGYAL